ncbi:toxin-antitoxin system, toxin component, HicA family [delta proteobacterium NaphS2]|nr:toxin-antitoxin system, toxin component, HicA family [delta proteobacterium NaphS2]
MAGLIMAKSEKIYKHILMRRSDANVPFEALCGLLKRLGFDERIKGDHHIFTRDGVEEILNFQPRDGKGKPYQVKQVREIILKYHLSLESQNGQEV